MYRAITVRDHTITGGGYKSTFPQSKKGIPKQGAPQRAKIIRLIESQLFKRCLFLAPFSGNKGALLAFYYGIYLTPRYFRRGG